METGPRQLGPLTRAVNSGSGNRALVEDQKLDNENRAALALRYRATVCII